MLQIQLVEYYHYLNLLVQTTYDANRKRLLCPIATIDLHYRTFIVIL
jgi:hypothetical protein